MAAIQSSVSFLEARINELLVDCTDQHISKLPPSLKADTESIRLIGGMYNYLERESIRNKYNIVLHLAGKQEIDRSKEIWDDATTLIDFRNFLVHFKPKTQVLDSEIDDMPVDSMTMEKKLQNKHIQKNQLHMNLVMTFPGSYLSAGCAKWAIEAAKAFFNEFDARLNDTADSGTQ